MNLGGGNRTSMETHILHPELGVVLIINIIKGIILIGK